MLRIKRTSDYYKLESLVFALVGSLIYMVVLVAYVKSNFNLTLDVRDELVIGFWLVIIGIIYTVLECFTRRCSNNTIKD